MSVIARLVGKSSGTGPLNLTEQGMLLLISQLLCEELNSVEKEIIDGMLEIGNMIAGRVREALQDTDYQIANISLPSVIFGNGYQVLYSRGLSTAGVEFELEGLPFSIMNDRCSSSTVSLLPGSGV